VIENNASLLVVTERITWQSVSSIFVPPVIVHTVKSDASSRRREREKKLMFRDMRLLPALIPLHASLSSVHDRTTGKLLIVIPFSAQGKMELKE
jgi:hypothetical protein